MAEFKLTLNDPKTGKSYKREVKDQNARIFLGKNIGDSIKGEAIDLQGYEFVITGGSDKCGFPMRAGITGVRKKVYAYESAGLKMKRKGGMQRKTICGMTISENTSQINLKITKAGRESLEKKEEGEAKTEGKDEAKPAEKKEAAPKKEEPKPAKEEKKPAEKEEKAKKEAGEKKKREKPKKEKKETPKEEKK